jgi:hypothetical protein
MGLYAIARALEARLKALHVPIPVVYVLGAESTSSLTSTRERIVIIEPRDEKSSRVLPPRGIHINPRHPARMVDPGTLRIYARSALAGAGDQDHVDRAHRIRAQVIAQIEYIARSRKNVIEWGAGGLISLPDAGGSVFAGTVYEHDFTLDSSVETRTWEGNAQPTVVVGTDVEVVTATMVSDDGGDAGTPPDDADAVG